MARPTNPFTIWSQYLAARFAVAGLTARGLASNLRLAEHLGRGMVSLGGKHPRRAKLNLAASYPDWADEQLDRVTNGTFEHLVKLAMEVLYTPRLITPDTWWRHVRFNKVGPAIERLNRREPCIMLTGHLGNWEVMGYTLAILGYDIDAVARPIDNPKVNDWLLGIREQHGMRIITKFDAADTMTQVLDDGGALAFVADQNAGPKGVFVPFFGRLASTYKSIALLAMTRNVPIYCAYAHRLPILATANSTATDASGEVDHAGLNYEVGLEDVITPDDWADQADPIFYITARYTHALEQSVRRQPDQYFWMHRRWKSRPRHELKGKSMPKLMRENMLSLPWVDDAMLEKLDQPTESAF